MPMRRVLVGLVLVLALCACERVGGEAFQATRNGVVDLDDAQLVGQSFASPTQTVTGVDLLIATYDQTPDPDGVLQVDLVDLDRGDVLATSEVAGTDLADNRWVAMRFDEPVAVEGPAAVLAGWDGTSQVGLHANIPPQDRTDEELLNDPYPGGELILDGEAAPGDLAFRVTGDPGPGTVAETAWGLIRGAGSALLRQPVFGVGWAVLMAASTALMVYGRRRSRSTSTHQ